MTETKAFYRVAIAVGTALAPVAGAWNRKIILGHEGRAASLAAFREWAAASRDRSKPLVWFHAPSVGEARQAEAVMCALRRLQPDWQIGFSCFSPSAAPFLTTLPADLTGYLPYDRVEDVTEFLNLLSPTVLIFTKLDLWPELATRAHQRGIKVGLITGTVRPQSGRLRWPIRALLRPGYSVLDAVGTASEDDADRLAQLGVKPDRIQTLGDPRYDSVAARVAEVSPEDPLLALGKDAWTIVAGSTWPPDHQVLLSAFRTLRRQHPEVRLILVPHEPSARQLHRIERTAEQLRLPPPGPVAEADKPAPLMIEDRSGRLARLYGAGKVAHVGGGFGSAGLHSVLEPSAWTIPVTVGPRWHESLDASRLLAQGGGLSIRRGATGAADLVRAWTAWQSDEAARVAAGRAARAVVDQGRGAAERCARMVEGLVTSVALPRLQT
ncbi:MAG TPA: glycosyltransferase N-terminal domain-containing protein [Gemmatimonadales bacterium]|nr:glycosyltransferase N-terminal domain-containing protein [Gemmatimonadales bacterium]